MTLQRILPTRSTIDPDAPGRRQALLEEYEPAPGSTVRLNLVTTLDGRAAGADGTSESLTTGTDRMILGVIRQSADAVLVGASTVRAESLGRPRRTPLVVLSVSGDLRGHGFDATTTQDGAARADVLVVTTDRGADTVRRTLAGTAHDVLVLDGGDAGSLPLERVLAALRERGLHRIVAEGGPALASGLLSARLVDELCLTVVPRIAGSGIPIIDAAVSLRADPRLLLVDDDGVLYGRWGLSPER
ncbi:MAG: dihydrofolate reductase family protein [Microcella sp.]|uniref:dihydrofolate reductase family protein n=1 Tax=Microcella sp. TaxID=1913979 RepID=UPI003314F7FF